MPLGPTFTNFRSSWIIRMSLHNEIEVFTERYEGIQSEELRIPDREFARYKGASATPVYKTEWIHHQLHELCREGDWVLELGSGDGKNLSLMVGARHVPYRLCGAEITLQGCRVARERLRVNGLNGSSASLQVADGNRLPYGTASLNGVVGFNILHHLDLHASLREVHRVLKPGGWGLFTEPVILSKGLDRFRKMIPYQPEVPTDDERPLRPEDFEFIRDLFTTVRVDHFELTSRLYSIWKWRPLTIALHHLDYCVIRVLPFLRDLYSGCTVLVRR